MRDESQRAEPEEEIVEEAIIPEDDFREAIAACRQDPGLDLYFKMAPRGAKLFIGLGFYSTHFGDRVDPRQYAECQAEIEPALTITDLTYLIRFERDKGTKKYLRELLARRKAELTADDTEPDAPPKRKARRQVASATPTLRSESAEEAAGGKIPTPAKIAAAAGLLLVVGLAVYFSQRSADRPSSRQRTVAAAGSDGGRDKPSDRLARADSPQPEQDMREEDAQPEEGPPAAGTDDDEGETPPEVAETPSEPAPTADGNELAPDAAIPRKGTPRVVFTDGKKIVRRPGGVVEVPRVFSCAGAGVKPFWVYGEHPEAEAAKEMKAREEWQALVRQAEKGTP